MHNNIVTELSKIISIKCTNHQFKLNLHFTALNRFTRTACYNQDRLHWNSRQKTSTDDYKQKKMLKLIYNKSLTEVTKLIYNKCLQTKFTFQPSEFERSGKYNKVWNKLQNIIQ